MMLNMTPEQKQLLEDNLQQDLQIIYHDLDQNLSALEQDLTVLNNSIQTIAVSITNNNHKEVLQKIVDNVTTIKEIAIRTNRIISEFETTTGALLRKKKYAQKRGDSLQLFSHIWYGGSNNASTAMLPKLQEKSEKIKSALQDYHLQLTNYGDPKILLDLKKSREALRSLVYSIRGIFHLLYLILMHQIDPQKHTAPLVWKREIDKLLKNSDSTLEQYLKSTTNSDRESALYVLTKQNDDLAKTTSELTIIYYKGGKLEEIKQQPIASGKNN